MNAKVEVVKSDLDRDGIVLSRTSTHEVVAEFRNIVMAEEFYELMKDRYLNLVGDTLEFESEKEVDYYGWGYCQWIQIAIDQETNYDIRITVG